MAVQTAISSTSGGRMGIPKAVVMVVTDRSIDSVQEAANEALTAGWWNSFLALLIHSMSGPYCSVQGSIEIKLHQQHLWYIGNFHRK